MSSGSPESHAGQDRDGRAGEAEAEEQEKREKRLREIRAQIEQIKKQIEETDGRQPSASNHRRERDSVDDKRAHSNDDGSPKEHTQDLNQSGHLKKSSDSKRRQCETIAKITNFKNKLREVSNTGADRSKPATTPEPTNPQDGPPTDDELERILDLVDGDSWLTHRFEANDNSNSILQDYEDERASQIEQEGTLRVGELSRQHHRGSDRSRSPSRHRSRQEPVSHRSRRYHHSSPHRDHSRQHSHRHRRHEEHPRSSSNRDKHRR